MKVLCWIGGNDCYDGVPELTNHKVTGWLVPAEVEKQLAESIVTLGHNRELRNGLAENVKRNMVPGFSAEKYLWLVESYYNQVCRTFTREG